MGDRRRQIGGQAAGTGSRRGCAAGSAITCRRFSRSLALPRSSTTRATTACERSDPQAEPAVRTSSRRATSSRRSGSGETTLQRRLERLCRLRPLSEPTQHLRARRVPQVQVRDPGECLEITQRHRGSGHLGDGDCPIEANDGGRRNLVEQSRRAERSPATAWTRMPGRARGTTRDRPAAGTARRGRLCVVAPGPAPDSPPRSRLDSSAGRSCSGPRDAIRDPGPRDLGFHADEALWPSWPRAPRGHQRSRPSTSHKRAQGEGDLRVLGEGGVAASEDQPQHVVANDAVGHRFLAGGAEVHRGCLLALAMRFPTQHVQRLAACGHGEPGARVVGDTRRRPVAERGNGRLLHGILGELKIANRADQRREDAAALGSDNRVQRAMRGIRHASMFTQGRTSTRPCQAVGIRCAQEIASSRSAELSR